LNEDLVPSDDYLHYVLKKAIASLQLPPGEDEALKEAIRKEELLKPDGPALIEQAAVAPTSKREAQWPEQVEMLAERFTSDPELDLRALVPADFLDKLLTRAGDLLPKLPVDAGDETQLARAAEQRDLAVDALGKLLADRKVDVNQARHIMAKLPHEDLVAIESRKPHTQISNIAHICVMLEAVRAGEGEARSAQG
jgi:hypothetical protein